MTQSLLDCGVAALTGRGHAVPGDRYTIQPFEGGVLVAVIDGLGHGAEAAEAAIEAQRVIEQQAGDQVLDIIHSCHDALRRTRGAVLSLASFQGARGQMVWAGVGNVEGLLIRADGGVVPETEMLLLRPGVVGHNLPPVTAAIVPVTRGDTLILASDGVDPGFLQGLPAGEAPQRLSERILTLYGTGTDDATVVTARYRGYEL